MPVSEKKIAVVLSGCGVFDGSEIHEATCALLNIADQGAAYQCFAPDIEQTSVINHYTRQAEPDQSRNVLVEAARIARGNIKSLAEFTPERFDAIIFPGGQGAAKNLCDFAAKGADCSVNPVVAETLNAAFAEQMPIGAICIAPALVARVLGKHGITVTIGNDPQTAAEIEKTGARHQNCDVDGICVDHRHKIVSTPAYMLAISIAEVNTGIAKLVREIINLSRKEIAE